jgi:Tripartite tricarboxylate transporter TctB family
VIDALEGGPTQVRPLVRSPKDFGAGLVYVAFGVAAVWIGRDYPFGTGARMGPGYFPSVLGGLLVLFGLAAVVRSFLQPGESIGTVAWKPLFLVVAATVAFAFLLPRIGLPVSLVILVLVSAAASERFRFDWRPALGLVALVAFCTLVFVTALGVPLPLFGTWLGE